MAKRFFTHCESSDPSFRSDDVLMEDQTDVVQLPSLVNFLDSIPTDPVKKAACGMYIRLVEFLKTQLNTIQSRLHLYECQKDATGIQSTINKRMHKARLLRVEQKKISKTGTEGSAEQRFDSFVNSDFLKRTTEKYLKLTQSVVDEFVYEELLAVRNYVMANLLAVVGRERESALRNMTLQEFNSAFDSDLGVHSVNVAKHTRSRRGPATVPFTSPDLWTIACLYRDLIRPKLVARRVLGHHKPESCFGSRPFAIDLNDEGKNPFFLSKHGRHLVMIKEVVEYIERALAGRDLIFE